MAAIECWLSWPAETSLYPKPPYCTVDRCRFGVCGLDGTNERKKIKEKENAPLSALAAMDEITSVDQAREAGRVAWPPSQIVATGK